MLTEIPVQDDYLIVSLSQKNTLQIWAAPFVCQVTLLSIVLYNHLTMKSPHQARALRGRLDAVTSAEISPSRRTQQWSMHFLVQISIWNGKIKLNSEA